MDEASGSDATGVGESRTDRAQGLALVEQWRSSGQSVAQFCRERGVAAHRLYYWKRQVEPEARREARASAGEFVALEIRGASEAASPSKRSSEAAIEIVVGAIRVRIPAGCSRDSFVQILRWTAETLEV
jgi:transposase-like protein